MTKGRSSWEWKWNNWQLVASHRGNQIWTEFLVRLLWFVILSAADEEIDRMSIYLRPMRITTVDLFLQPLFCSLSSITWLQMTSFVCRSCPSEMRNDVQATIPESRNHAKSIQINKWLWRPRQSFICCKYLKEVSSRIDIG